MDDRAFVEAAFGRAGKQLLEAERLSIIERKSELHRELIKDELPLFPGVVTFLKATSRRYTLGLVSMARRVEIDHVLERAHLAKIFALVISAEGLPGINRIGMLSARLGKLNARRQNNTLPPIAVTECVAIEDAPPGIAAAGRWHANYWGNQYRIRSRIARRR